jgi:hypothetical protein
MEDGFRREFSELGVCQTRHVLNYECLNGGQFFRSGVQPSLRSKQANIPSQVLTRDDAVIHNLKSDLESSATRHNHNPKSLPGLICVNPETSLRGIEPDFGPVSVVGLRGLTNVGDGRVRASRGILHN